MIRQRQQHLIMLCVLLSLIVAACATTPQPLPTNTRQPVNTSQSPTDIPPTRTPLPPSSTVKPETTKMPESVLKREDVPPAGVVAQLQFAQPTATMTPDPRRQWSGCMYPPLRMGDSIEYDSIEVLQQFNICFVEFDPNIEVLVQFIKPDSGTAKTDAISPNSSGDGWWHHRVLPSEPLGTYKIALIQGNSRAEGTVEIVPATHPGMLQPEQSRGSAGDVFEFSFAGFQLNQPLHLWHQDEANHSSWIYWTMLPSPDIDARGEGIYVLMTQPNDPTGCYMISPGKYASIYNDPIFCIYP